MKYIILTTTSTTTWSPAMRKRVSCNPVQRKGLGSDAYHTQDGRYSLTTITNNGYDLLKKYPKYTGFIVVNAPSFLCNERYVFEYVTNNNNYNHIQLVNKTVKYFN